MSEEEFQPPVEEQEIDSVDLALREIQEKYGSIPFKERMHRMLEGLNMPHDTGEYKWARLELQRLSGPTIAVVTCLLAITIMLLLPNNSEVKQRVIPVEVMEVEPPPDIEEEPPEPPEPPEFLEPCDADVDGPSGEFSPVETVSEMTNEPVSAKPAEMTSVAIVKSPIVMRGIFGSRSPGARGAALGKYGAGGGDATVYRAMRWLKMQQSGDGSWGANRNSKTALTGMAILVYLAHGETPAPDTEFGPTVEKAIRYLCDNQDAGGYFAAKDGSNYSHPIATYALGEAYAMTKNPLVKEAAEKAVIPIIKGQNGENSWDYNMAPGSGRSDTSYAGWCAQAIKAVHTAGCEAPGLDECYEKAKKAFLVNYCGDSYGGFAYANANGGRGGQHCGLSGCGALCMQLLGEYNASEVKATMRFLENCQFSFEKWDQDQPWGGGNSSPIYYWYYITQAKFQEGGSTFAAWNKQFLPELMKQQVQIKADQSGYVDLTGKPRDIGYWDSPSKGEAHPQDGAGSLPAKQWQNGVLSEGTTSLSCRVMDTCLCALQLMVYYRFLPSSQLQNEDLKKAQEESAKVSSGDDKKKKDIAVKKKKKVQ